MIKTHYFNKSLKTKGWKWQLHEESLQVTVCNSRYIHRPTANKHPSCQMSQTVIYLLTWQSIQGISSWHFYELKMSSFSSKSKKKSHSAPEPSSTSLSYLDPAHSELSQGSAHLWRRGRQVLRAGDDFYQQGVIVGWDDSALEGRSAVQTDAHAFTAPEDLTRPRVKRQTSYNGTMSSIHTWIYIYLKWKTSRADEV